MTSLRAASKRLFSAVDRLLPDPTGPRILIYHQVGTHHGHQMEVDLDDFRAQMSFLETGYEVVPLEVALARWSEPGAERLVVLTFDDGYVDTFTRAFPILETHGFPFTLYLATKQVEDARTAIERSSLDWDQVNEMLGTGLLTLGAHTHSHADLRTLDRASIFAEIEHSNRVISERTGVAPSHFAYPWGYWSETGEAVVAKTYTSAVLGGTFHLDRRLQPHRVPRFPVQHSDGIRFFAARLEGGLLAEEWVRRRLKGYRGP